MRSVFIALSCIVLEPLDHYCVHRVMENGDKISYMMKYDPQTTKRGLPPTETSE
jgi:hypothetical protein